MPAQFDAPWPEGYYTTTDEEMTALSDSLRSLEKHLATQIEEGDQ